MFLQGPSIASCKVERSKFKSRTKRCRSRFSAVTPPLEPTFFEYTDHSDQLQGRVCFLCLGLLIFVAYTGWLNLKYPTWQNAISRQPCEIFISKFLGLYGRDPATILKLFLNIIFFKSYDYINILCHIFNFARDNPTATGNFHCQETLTVITNTKIWQVGAYVRSYYHQLSHKRRWTYYRPVADRAKFA